jgi:hypothetical protein
LYNVKSMLKARFSRSTGGRAGYVFAAGLCLSLACGSSEFSAGEEQPGGAGSDNGGSDSGGESSSTGGTGNAGKGSTSGGRDGGGGTAFSSEACEDYIQAVCEWEGHCNEGVPGSREACQRANANACAWYALPGSNVGPDDFFACIRKYETGECTSDYFECELPAGSVGNGFPCASPLQCESGYCGAVTDGCGVCAPNPNHRNDVGGACVSYSNCLPELTCVEGECAPRAAEGEACDGERVCTFTHPEAYLACVDGVCTAVGFVGDACFEQNGARLCGPSSTCLEGKCVPRLSAELGEPCGETAESVISCNDGACHEVDGALVCVAWAGPGESCRKIPNYERCARGLTCENGTCVWPAPYPPPADDCSE